MKRKKREKTIPEQFVERYGYTKPFEPVLNMSLERLKDIVCGVTDLREEEALATIAFWHAAYDWNRYKQIYRFSDELYNDIKNMEDERIPSEVLQLPFPCIYVDLTGQSKTFRGVMIDLQERQCEINGPKEKSLIIGFIRDEPDGSDWYASNAHFIMPKTVNGIARKLCYADPQLDYDEIMTIIRLILYLSSSKPDLEKHSISQESSVYSKGSAVRRSPKAIAEQPEEWDVGVRYAVEKTNHVKSTKSSAKMSHGTNDSKMDDVNDIRKRPKAHIRKAHWHLYWTGEGRKTPVVHYLPPTIINAGNSEMPVTIRKKDSI